MVTAHAVVGRSEWAVESRCDGKASVRRMRGTAMDWMTILALPEADAGNAPPAPSTTPLMEVTRSSRARMRMAIHGWMAESWCWLS